MRYFIETTLNLSGSLACLPKKVLLALTTVALFSIPALAEQSIGSTSKTDFNLIMKQWKFECTDPEFLKYMPEVEGFMSQTVPEIIWKGLRELDYQNPEFVEQVFRNIRESKVPVKVSCAYSKDSRVAGEQTTLKIKPLFKIGKYTIGIPTDENTELKVGKAIIECLVSDKIKDTKADRLFERGINIQNEVLKYKVKGSDLVKESCHQTIFHEFLHLAKADNKHVDEHNNSEMQKLDDVVYACTRTAFRHGAASLINLPAMNATHMPDAMIKRDWVKSCRTCTLAQFRSYELVGNSESPAEDARAQHSCSRLYDDIPKSGVQSPPVEPPQNEAVLVNQ